MHILTNTSRSKGNQAMKFGQLIENTRASIFLEKSWTKLGGETIRSLKNKNWEYFWITILKFYKVCFHCIPSWGLTEYLSNRPLAFTSYKVFFFLKKKKRRVGTNLSASFSALFLKKNISLGTFYYRTKFHSVVAFTSWDIGQYVYCLLTSLWRHKFWS